ncbi:MAG TPA: alpha/beta hydrolase [Acidimicrobiales bacterium]|nr:alpha/beta hydrolase [Acidimicrobiales bacterium]
MPLDPAVSALLAQLPALETEITPEAMRERSSGPEALLMSGGDPSVEAVDHTATGPAGDIPVRLYTPPTGHAPRPLVVFFHGGGWVIGDLQTHDGVCRNLAAGTGAAVLAVDYRLAPEHPFPAPVEDAWAALQWAHANAGSLGADPSRLAVAGDSAGGNLAAVMALMARDAGLALRFQLLVYPATDFSERRPSRAENGEGYLLTEASMAWFEGHYAPDVRDWRASPMLAPDHRGVAPAMVLTCEFDPLRDEGNDYAAKLAAASIPVTNRCYPGLIHGSFSMLALIPSAKAMMQDACEALRDALSA